MDANTVLQLQNIVDNNNGGSLGWNITDSPAHANGYGITETNGQLEKLDINGAGLYGTLAFHGVSSLTELDAGGNSFTGVSFSGLDNLQTLYLYSNQLSSLAPGTFSGLGNLLILYLNSNQLNSLAPGTFSGLGNLLILDLNSNMLMGLDSGTFSGLGSLEKLYLNNNPLSNLPPDTFSGLANLQTLELNNTRLSSLAPGTFSSQGSLQSLYLGDNQLSSLPPDIFSDLGNLSTLLLNSNQLSSLDSGTFSGLVSLNTLNIANNRLPLSQVQAVKNSPPGLSTFTGGGQRDVYFVYCLIDKDKTYELPAADMNIEGHPTTATHGVGNASVASGVVSFPTAGSYTIKLTNTEVTNGDSSLVDSTTGTFVAIDYSTPLTNETDLLSFLNNEGIAETDLNKLGYTVDEDLVALVNQALANQGFFEFDYMDGASTGPIIKPADTPRIQPGQYAAAGITGVREGAAKPFTGAIQALALAPFGSGPAALAYSSDPQSLATASGPSGLASPWRATAQVLGGYWNFSKKGGYDGYDLKLYSGLGSIDYNWESFRLGLALNVGTLEQDFESNKADSDTDFGQAALYAAWGRGDFRLAGAFTFGTGSVDASRNLGSASGEADYDLNWYGLSLAAAQDFAAGDFVLTPSLSATWLRVHNESYTEKFSNGNRIRFGSDDQDSFELGAQLMVALPLELESGRTASPYLGLGLAWELGDRNTSLNGAWVSGPGGNFKAEDHKIGRVRFDLTAGVDLALHENVSLGLAYKGGFAEGMNSHQGMLELKFTW